MKAERAFRRLLEEAKELNALAVALANELVVGNGRIGVRPGKSTRVLVEEQRSPSIPEPTSHHDAGSPVARLRLALETAVQRTESAARAIAGSDAKTITEALRQLGQEPGSPLAAIDNGALAQVLRLVEALVTLTDPGRGAGKSLPSPLRHELESRIGVDLGALRVHDDPAAADEASRHGAVAFARGTDVYFAQGMYDPATPSGKRLIAHEATHVVQQRGGGRAAPGAMSEPGSAVEREADRVANAFAAGVAPGARAFAVTERAPAGTISRDTAPAPAPGTPAAAAAGPKEWKINLLGQVLDLSAQVAALSSASAGGGSASNELQINQTVGPIRITKATFKASGDKVESGTLEAAVDSGTFKGTSGTLTVDSAGAVSGTLTVPVKVPGLFVKEVSLQIGAGSLTGKVTVAAGDFVGPDFPVKVSDLELSLTSNGSSISAGLTGGATVGIENGLASGEAKMEVELHADSSGVSFSATITGKIDILGIAGADATLTYDGKTVAFKSGSDLGIQMPGLEGKVKLSYLKGKLQFDTSDLNFTFPQLKPVKLKDVKDNLSKLDATLTIDSPITVPLPGGATVTLEQSTIKIAGGKVGGNITGSFALNNNMGLAGKVELAYNAGDFAGSITIAGGAKFSVGGVDITVDDASTLAIAKGMGVSGDVAASIKIPGIPQISVHVVASSGQPIDLTCDAHIPLQSIVSQLGGDLHVEYHRGGGANAFTLDATDVTVSVSPLNGQVIFSQLKAQIAGGQITGLLTAAPGTAIKAGGTTVTIMGGTVHLLPGKILDGQLQARSDTAGGAAGGTAVEATVGWKMGKFDWAADGTFDLGQLTRQQILGSVHAKAGSDGTGEFETNGAVTFGSPMLKGIVIEHLSGNVQTRVFTAKIQAADAITKLGEKVPNVLLTAHTAEATITYTAAGLHLDGTIDGSARYPKSGSSQLEGDFHATYVTGKGFTGKLDNVKLTASEYFKSSNGTADLEDGHVDLGAATFSVPGIVSGAVNVATVNIKTNQFHVEADLAAQTPALKGLQIKVAVDNTGITAKLIAGAPPIPIDDFATLTVGADSTVTIAKGTGLSAHILGTVDATGMGKGTFDMTYANRGIRGTAHVHVDPFAMFDAVELNLNIDSNRKFSTTSDVELRLAPQYSGEVVASAKVSVVNNKFSVSGKVTEVKNLGKISEAFQHGGGAEITWHQATKQVTMSSTFDVGGSVIPQLASGSNLKFAFAGNLFMIDGVLKPKDYGPLKFTPDSHISASWTSALRRMVVTGEAHADLAQLCTADFTVDAGLGGGAPGSFGLRGHIDATKLAQKMPGITFSSVTAPFTVLIGESKPADVNFHVNAQISAIPAAGVSEITASIDADYKSGQGLTGGLTVSHAKLGDVIADGRIEIANNKFRQGTLHLRADFPSLNVEGTGQVTAGDMNGLTTTAELKVTPGAGSALAKFVQSGSIHVDIQKWKLANAVGQLHLVPPQFLPIENTVIEVGYKPGAGLHATLSTQFNAPMAKHGEKGTFVAGYARDRGLFAHIEFPVTVPGFQAATVAGDLDGKGIKVSATLIPKDAKIIKQATIEIGYEMNSGLYLAGSITLAPSDELELVVGVRYDQHKGLQVEGITPRDKAATPAEHEVAHWHKDFPTIPLATVGVASLGLKFGLGVAAGYRMPRIAFKNPQLEGGLDALDKGGMPAFTFGGQIAMGAYITLSMSVQVVGEIQLLIATCDAGIGAEIAARLNLDLGADVNGRFAPGQGALLNIDPFVGASLDLIAALICTLHAEICWFTIVDKKWTLASANFAHIDLGQFHPFNPVGVQIGGPGGTHLTNGLGLRNDAFDQIKQGVQQGGAHAGDEEANEDARKRVAPVLKSFKSASHQFEQLPPGWEKGMTAPPVEFHSMFPVTEKEWDFYQDHADTAEKIDPADACVTPTEKLAKAVGVTARKDPGGAGRLILAWRRAQIAHMGINPDTGINVVLEREQVQAHLQAEFQLELTAALAKQKQQEEDYAAHVKKQQADYQKAETAHEHADQQQKSTHDAHMTKTQGEWTEAQQKKVTAAHHAQDEGVKVSGADQVKAPPPPKPPAPVAPKALAKPAPIPKPPPVPMPKPPEVLPAVTKPALPTDPGVSVHAAASTPPMQKQIQPEMPGAKTAPTGGTPDPTPGTASNAKQVGGGGGAPAKIGGGNSGGGKAGGGAATSSAPAPGPAVTAGPEGIISQQKTLDAKEKQVEQLEVKNGTGTGKPGVLGKLGGAPTAAPAPAAAGKPGAPAAAGKSGPPSADKAALGLAVDPTVQAVVAQGKGDELAYKQKLDQQDQTYTTKIHDQDKAAEDEAKKLDKEAAEAKKRKEREAALARAGGRGAQPGDKGDGKDKPKGPFGTRVALNIDGENHTLYIEDSGMAMVASTPTPLTGKLDQLASPVNAAPSIKPLAASTVQQAQADAQHLAVTAAKAVAGDESANSALSGEQQKVAGPLKTTWEWSKVASDQAVTGGSIDNPLLHPYYPEFRSRVATLSAKGHISVDATPFAESTWTKICKAVKAANPAMTNPAAYSNLEKGWLNMKSPEFQKAIREFDAIGKELAKVGSSQFARANNFGFWSKDEGRSLAQQISDLTLETSAVGTLMDGLPTLDDKKAGWDPEIWGALSKAYATAVVPEVVKGKKINVCIGAGVPPGNIWEAVESVALRKGLQQAGVTLEHVTTNYAAAAKSKDNRRELNDTKHASGIKGCLFVGDRNGAINAADAYFKTLDAQPAAAGTGAAAKSPVATKVPMTVGGEGHTHYIDPSGKPMVASTPTPVSDKLTELNAKLASLPAADPKRADAATEITHARSLEARVADLAKKAAAGTGSSVADLNAAMTALAASVQKIWEIADPGAMDAVKARQAIDSRATDCTDISEPLSKDWVGKPRAAFESHFLDGASLRHALIEKYLAGAPDREKIQVIGSRDPIAVQKFKDIDAEQHLDPRYGDLKGDFYAKLHAELVKPTFTDRTRTYPVMQKAAGFSFNCKGVAIPADRLSPLSARNHSVDKLYDNAKNLPGSVALIEAEIDRALRAKGAKASTIAAAKRDDNYKKKAYRHLLKSHPAPLDTIDKTKPISPFPTWYAPGEIIVNAGAPPNKEFARMMTLGALQPEWYPSGTAVLRIERKLAAAARTIFKPTAFDGLMSALWTARNVGDNDYGVTGGGLPEFLEGNVLFSEVTQASIIIPSDPFLADMQNAAAAASKDNSTPTEELLRGNAIDAKRKNVNTSYGQILDRSATEQNHPGAAPVAPGAARTTSSAGPGAPAAARTGAYDRVDGSRPNAAAAVGHPVPAGTSKAAGTPAGLDAASSAPGVAHPGTTVAPAQGGAQANDARTAAQTAAGAQASPGFGGKSGESVADAAKRLHPDSQRDSHFNPVEKVAFERDLAAALLGRSSMYDVQVNEVSAAILKYFNDRLAAGVTAGMADAHKKYVTDLAKLTADSKPGWWGAVEVSATATKEQVADQTRQSLTRGTLPQKMAVHQNFLGVLQQDYKAHVAQAFLDAAAVDPWYVRQQTKLKDGKLDKANGVPVFDKAHQSERGRVTRPDTHAVSPAAPGIAARGDTGAAPASVLPAGTDPQQVYRGLDSFTMDEAKAFCQRARLEINMPLAAGVSGSTAELINVAKTLGLSDSDLQKYAIAVLAYIGGGGNHSYHEIAIVLAAAGLKIDPDTYNGLDGLIDHDLFAKLKHDHPAAFRDAKPDATGTAPGA